MQKSKFQIIIFNMIFRKPKDISVVEKKFTAEQAIALDDKIVQVGAIMTKKQYSRVMNDLKKKYPNTNESDFVHTFIFGKKRAYII